ncbi:MAG: hypothetical protein ACXWTR_02990 [Methylotenera sp.]
MKLAQLIVLATYGIAHNWGDSLSLASVQQWVKENSNRDNYGSGYAGNSLPNARSNAFAEIRRETSGGSLRVIANVYYDAKQGAVASKTWNVKRMDSKLEKLFGHNLRVRIDV